MEIFHVSTCPVCVNWCLMYEGSYSHAEIEQVLMDHLMECFGMAELFADQPWAGA